MANSLNVLPQLKDELRIELFDAAHAVNVDVLATTFHACHREYCHHESGVEFQILNFMELIGEAMGLHHPDHYKRLKMMNDVDAMVSAMQENIVHHNLDLEAVREALWIDMFAAVPPARV
ncbi:MAG: hypothetical protein AAF493_18525 [Pseudomonadota bacterium]